MPTFQTLSFIWKIQGYSVKKNVLYQIQFHPYKHRKSCSSHCLIFPLCRSNNTKFCPWPISLCPYLTRLLSFPASALLTLGWEGSRRGSSKARQWVLTASASRHSVYVPVSCQMRGQFYHIPTPQALFPPAEAGKRDENDVLWFLWSFQHHPAHPAWGEAQSDSGGYHRFLDCGLTSSLTGSSSSSSRAEYWTHCRAAQGRPG